MPSSVVAKHVAVAAVAATGAALLGFSAGGLAGMDSQLAAAARPAPQRVLQNRLVTHRECPRPRDEETGSADGRQL